MSNYLSDACNTAVDSRLVGKNPATDLDSRTGWASDYDWTGVSTSQPRATAIAADIVVGAEHYPPGVTVTFPGGITRTIIASATVAPANDADGYATDIWVGRLDTPLPGGTKFYPIGQADLLTAKIGYEQLPIAVMGWNQDGKGSVYEWYYWGSGYEWIHRAVTVNRQPFTTNIRVGDSGNPSFLLADEPILLTTWTTAITGPAYRVNAAGINAAIAATGSSSTVSIFDASAYASPAAPNSPSPTPTAPAPTEEAVITSAQSGAFSSTSTWIGGVVPVPGVSTFFIAAGNVVTAAPDGSDFAGSGAGGSVSIASGSFAMTSVGDIVNAGTIIGPIIMGSAADSFTNSGRITGNVDNANEIPLTNSGTIAGDIDGPFTNTGTITAGTVHTSASFTNSATGTLTATTIAFDSVNVINAGTIRCTTITGPNDATIGITCTAATCIIYGNLVNIPSISANNNQLAGLIVGDWLSATTGTHAFIGGLYGTMAAGITLSQNNGYIAKNSGTITANNGAVANNTGTVTTNAKGIVIQGSGGTVGATTAGAFTRTWAQALITVANSDIRYGVAATIGTGTLAVVAPITGNNGVFASGGNVVGNHGTFTAGD